MASGRPWENTTEHDAVGATRARGDVSTLCPLNPPSGDRGFVFSRKNGRAVLQQRLYYVQPRGRADDRSAGDRHGAEL